MHQTTVYHKYEVINVQLVHYLMHYSVLKFKYKHFPLRMFICSNKKTDLLSEKNDILEALTVLTLLPEVEMHDCITTGAYSD